LLPEVPQWRVDHGMLVREFSFKDHWETMAFVNAAAWVAHREDHHPDVAVGYNRVRYAWSTHSAGGLARNDFICAAKLDALLELC
jgi:4a-hydroxytetrahydrobiopterin dehydratase